MAKTAVVVGASSAVGRELVRKLEGDGVRVTPVGRDATEAGLAERVLREVRPELLVLTLGVRPRMASFDEMSWEEFSEAWNVDTKAAFLWAQAALRVPLAAGSSIVIVSSGAAIQGSWRSGGYAGAKRMQWMLASYAQKESDARKLGIRTIAVLPTQLIEGTKIAERAAAHYGALAGTDATGHMRRWDQPLDAGKVAEAILGAWRGEVPEGVTAIGVSGKGVEPLP
jgi:NAD(P)-dependent dehydrogenase (short-subunit alcohol dehydrogenase family)